MKILFLIISMGLTSIVIAQEAPERHLHSSWMVQKQKQLNLLQTGPIIELANPSILQIRNETNKEIQLTQLYNPHLAFFCRIERDLSTFFDMDIDIGVK